MPKLFPILIEVEELAVGKVYRMLDGAPGVAKIKIGDVMAGKPNGHAEGEGFKRGPYKERKPSVYLADTGEEAVAKVLYGGPPLNNGQLRDIFASQGRSPHSINSVLHAMKTKGELKLNDAGQYLLTQKVRDRLRHRKAAKKSKK